MKSKKMNVFYIKKAMLEKIALCLLAACVVLVIILSANSFHFLKEIVMPLAFFDSHMGNQMYIETVNNELDEISDEENGLAALKKQMVAERVFRKEKNVLEKDEIVRQALLLHFPENGTRYSYEEVTNKTFARDHFYSVDASTELTDEMLDLESMLNEDMTIDLHEKEPVILIYHTHGSEDFVDSREGKIEDTIIGMGDYLTKILQEQYQIPVYHDRTVYDMVDGELDRSYAYTLAGNGIDQILSEHESIEVVIDLHRDGVAENTHLVETINGKPTAQVMLLNGISHSKNQGEISYLRNPYRADNMAFALQCYLAGEQMYDGYFRKIFVRSYRYNLDRRKRSLLVEAGAQTNTCEEEKNAMDVLALILFKVLSQHDDYDILSE